MVINHANGAVTYFKRYGFSINEGGMYATICIMWMRPWCYFFIYIGLPILDWRRSWCLKRTKILTSTDQESK